MNRFITLCSSGLPPSVPCATRPSRNHLQRRLRKSLQCFFVNNPPSSMALLCSSLKSEICSPGPFKHIRVLFLFLNMPPQISSRPPCRSARRCMRLRVVFWKFKQLSKTASHAGSEIKRLQNIVLLRFSSCRSTVPPHGVSPPRPYFKTIFFSSRREQRAI